MSDEHVDREPEQNPEPAAEESAAPSPVAKLLAAATASFAAYRWWWVGGGGGVVVVAAAIAVVVFGGFLGPSGKDICTQTLTQAKDFGVIPMSAALASSSAESTDVKDRRKCTAQAGDDTYNLLANVKLDDKACKDMKAPGCVGLYSVARTDGLVTYQVREIPPDETDAAIAASENQNAAADGGSNAQGGGSDIDTETAVDNSGATSGPSEPAQANPPDSGQPPPQQ